MRVGGWLYRPLRRFDSRRQLKNAFSGSNLVLWRSLLPKCTECCNSKVPGRPSQAAEGNTKSRRRTDASSPFLDLVVWSSTMAAGFNPSRARELARAVFTTARIAFFVGTPTWQVTLTRSMSDETSQNRTSSPLGAWRVWGTRLTTEDYSLSSAAGAYAPLMP